MKKNAVPEHYACMGCGDKLEQVKIFKDLYYCWECYDGKLRRERLLAAEKEFDESADETVETIE